MASLCISYTTGTQLIKIAFYLVPHWMVTLLFIHTFAKSTTMVKYNYLSFYSYIEATETGKKKLQLCRSGHHKVMDSSLSRTLKVSSLTVLL